MTGVALRLLGRQVLRRAHDRAHLRDVGGAGARDAEVGDLHVVLVVEDHVVRLEVAVDHVAAVREARPPTRICFVIVDRALRVERRLARDDLLERPPSQYSIAM